VSNLKYCPICNTASDKSEFVGEICISCFRKKGLHNLPGKLEIARCKRCGRVKSPLGWRWDKEATLNAIAERGLKTKNYKVSLKSLDYKAGKATAVFTTEVDGKSVDIEKEIELEVKNAICDACYKKAAGYYEAVVQIRGNLGKVETVIGRLTRYLEKRNAFVAKIDEYSYGSDVFTSDKKMTQSFLDGYRLHARKSFQLYGVKNGKKVYRHIYSVELDS
jgi:nonsense-mediated mRNA decay protein 3